MNPIRISITLPEFHCLAIAGISRRYGALVEGLRREKGRFDIVDFDVAGMIAEFAVAKHLGLFWSPNPGALDTNTGDLSGRIQVKSIDNIVLRLIIRDVDPDDFRYVLAYTQLFYPPFYVDLIGWLWGYERKCGERKHIDMPGITQNCWMIGKEKLEPMSSLVP